MSTKVDKPSAVFRVSQYLQLQDTELAERAANQLMTRKNDVKVDMPMQRNSAG